MYNDFYSQPKGNYLFREIASRVQSYCLSHPAPLNMGVGDVSHPIMPAVAQAMQAASLEMANPDTFRGYPPPFGYEFLREEVCRYYADLGVRLTTDEVYISSGAKDDLARWCSLFSPTVPAVLLDPTYPAYLDWQQAQARPVLRLAATAANGYTPPPDLPSSPHLILLCSPSNPTGACYTPAQLQQWVEYALQSGSIILLDAAYRRFAPTPFSIYTIPGARSCCVEVCTLSKSASFSGIRCGWSIVPTALPAPLRTAYRRCLATATNGVAYIIQRGAQAAITAAGVAYQDSVVARYLSCARRIANALDAMHCHVSRGPYLWLEMPYRADGWQYFDTFLHHGLVVTPGVGFGQFGRGHVRLSVFSVVGLEQQVIDRLYCAIGAK